jgi:tetratricopeptide (TPR) repeat protein
VHALLLALTLAAAPSLQQARTWAADKAWEELYLGFSAARPEELPTADRPALAGLMLDGSRALAGTDAVMAWSLAELAEKFHATPAGLLQLARTARATDQASAAEAALRRGLKQFPGDGELALELGRQLLEEQDLKGAAAVLEQVPAKSPRAAEARALLGKARAGLKEEKAALQEADAIERRILTGVPAASGGEVRPGGGTPSDVGSLTYESSEGAGGMRVRQNSRFRFRYFSQGRDFGQRAEYEGRIQAAMNEAWEANQRILGAVRSSALEVVLYSREEFTIHHGAGAARAMAGFYGDGAIRMNDSAEITAEVKSTLVHEYVHAVTDELAGNAALPRWFAEGIAEYVQWRYLGGDGPPLALASRMKAAAARGALPTLPSMASNPPLGTADPAAAYSFCALSVRELARQGGFPGLLQLLGDVKAGTGFDQALERRYGKTAETLDAAVRKTLAGR